MFNENPHQCEGLPPVLISFCFCLGTDFPCSVAVLVLSKTLQLHTITLYAVRYELTRCAVLLCLLNKRLRNLSPAQTCPQ